MKKKYIHDDVNQLIYSEFYENINQEKVFKIIYEIRKDQNINYQRLSIRTTNEKGENVSSIEKLYNEKLDVISISYYLDEKLQSNSISIEYQYDERSNWIERRIYNFNRMLFSLRKRKIIYK